MFEKSALFEETIKVRDMLDKAQYPETYAALSCISDNEDTEKTVVRSDALTTSIC